MTKRYEPFDKISVEAALGQSKPVEALRGLIAYWGANARDRHGATMLQRVLEKMNTLAANKRQDILVPLTEMLVAEGVDTEVLHNQTGEPLLIHALQNKKTLWVKALLRMGADRQARDPKTGQTAQEIVENIKALDGSAPGIRDAYDQAGFAARHAALNLGAFADPSKQLFVTGSDGKKRLSANALLVCEYNMLHELIDYLPLYTSLSQDEAIALVHEIAGLLPERHRDKLHASFLLRDAPLVPGTELLVEYARGSAHKSTKELQP